ncbi:MAG: M15 family metallopeptidase [Candidatus Binatia bacterium]
MFGNDSLFLQRFLKGLGYYEGELDGDCGPLTNAALRLFEQETESIANRCGRCDQRSETKIATLHPKAQELARQFLEAAAASQELATAGIVVKIISGTRTYQEQSELFAQGRTKPGNIVTKARAGQSNHNFGMAWDVGLFSGNEYLSESPLYDVVGGIGKQLGLEWGGDWASFPDRPHFQLKTEIALGEVRNRFEQGQAFV